jgi:hypothetical protein
MPFLLLLSALLTALTGAMTGVRPVEISAQRALLATDVHRVAVAAVPIASGHAHLLGAFGTAETFALIRVVPAALVAAPRLYLDRPRA